MTTREMVQENNRLREQMTLTNRDFYEDIVVYVRDSRADRQRGEQRLLDLAQEVLEAQQKEFRHPRCLAAMRRPLHNLWSKRCRRSESSKVPPTIS